MAWTVNLLTGLAEYVHSMGVADWAPDAPVTTLTRPVVIGPVPSTPDLCMGLIPYSPVDDPSQNDVLQPVQIWLRGDEDPATVRDWGDELRDALHGAEGLVFAGVHIILASRRSVVPMNADGNGRYEAAHNYYFQAAQPGRFLE